MLKFDYRDEADIPRTFVSSPLPPATAQNIEFQGDAEVIRDTPIMQHAARDTRYNRGNFIANYSVPDRAELRHGPWRPGVIQMNWAGLRTADTWQEFHATEDHKSVLDRQLPATLATRLWLIDQRARTPIAFSSYVVDPAALMAGNYRATNPQGSR